MSLPSDPRSRWILVLTAAASFMTALDAMVVSTALTTIRDDFGATIDMLSWSVNAYNLSFAVFLMTGAALGERFGRRRVLSAGLLMFTLASALCAWAPGIGWLIAGRALQGLGAALATPVSLAMLGTAFSGPARAAALGLFASITGLALIAGPVLGGAITQGLSWRWVFLPNLPIGVALIALIRARIAEQRTPDSAIDARSAALMVLSAAGLAWTLVRGPTAGWTGGEATSGIAVAVLGGIALVFANRRSPAPMLPPRLFAAPGFGVALIAAAMMYAPLYGLLFLLPQWLASLGAGVLPAALQLLPWTATLFIVAPLAGKAARRLGERRLAVTGLALQGLGVVALSAWAGRTASYPPLVPALLVAGAGISMAMPAVQSACLSAVAPRDLGRASGVFNSVRFFAGFVGIAVVSEVLRHGTGPGGVPALAGLSTALAVLAVLSLAGAAIAARLPRRSAPAPHATAAASVTPSLRER